MKLGVTTATGMALWAAGLVMVPALAQIRGDDLGMLYRFDLLPQEHGVRMEWGERATLSAYRDAIGLQLSGKGRARTVLLGGVDGSSDWLDPGSMSADATDSGRDLRRQLNGDAGSLKVKSKSYYTRDYYSRRWFVMPTPNWVLQFTRGHLSNLDQLEGPKHIQRSVLSASYRREFDGGMWQTTFAWGRHSSRVSPNTSGYLAESMLQFGKAHTVFGRLERVRSEDLLRDNEVVQGLARLNKLTAGYYYALSPGSDTKIDVGGMISRYSVPARLAPSYGNNPTSLLFFVRLQLP